MKRGKRKMKREKNVRRRGRDMKKRKKRDLREE